jgi:hypothetical protein
MTFAELRSSGRAASATSNDTTSRYCPHSRLIQSVLKKLTMVPATAGSQRSDVVLESPGKRLRASGSTKGLCVSLSTNNLAYRYPHNLAIVEGNIRGWIALPFP